MHQSRAHFIFLTLIVGVVHFFPFSLNSQSAPTEDLVVEKIYFYNRRGLDVKIFLEKSLNLDQTQGEFISLGLDPQRDRPQDGSAGSGHSGGLLLPVANPSEFALYHITGGDLTIVASPEKVKRAQEIVAIMDALPWQIQIETFVVKINKDEIERRNLEVSGVVNAIQEFQPTFLDPKLSPRTLQWAIGNQVNDFGSVHLELSDIDRMIEVSKNPVQKVLHGETSNILAGQRLIFTIASGLNATVQIEDTAYIVSVTPQFIPKDTRNNPADAVRLSIQIEDSTPRTNPDGSVDKIDRFNTSTSLILLEGQLLPLVKLDNNSKVETMEGVPNLKDVPLLGNLFRSRQSESSSIEYIVFVRATEYDIFEDANRIQDIDPFLWSTVHTVHILDSSLDTVYDLQFTKNQKNAILGRLTKDGIVVNAPFIVRIGWRRSANFISRIWKDTQRQTEQKNNSQARFSVGLLTEDDPEWVAHFSFYTLSSDNTLSKEPFLEMEEISLAEILDQL
ncbi:MAG: hypothetical protein A3B70_00695 [Deltaproteobacteria bacterium RIFCSPHIGHO2_02_FULL_40_11]|nr:MAG: hypothetical protein A3B70_00695 [Deltaproteobacteria bacterium RIFCSPHIGHO2_02_FULL_40_11]